MTGDKDDGNPNAGVHQLVLKVQAVDSRSLTSRTRQLGPSGRLLPRNLEASEGLGTQADRLQHALNGSTHQVVVIHNEHGGSTCGRHSRSLPHIYAL